MLSNVSWNAESLFLFNLLKMAKPRYLILVSFLWAFMILTSYSACPFVLFVQILWFYRPRQTSSLLALLQFYNEFAYPVAITPMVSFHLLNYPGKI